MGSDVDRDGYGYVSPRVARLIRVDIDAEKWDAVRAGELQLTSAGQIPMGRLPRFPEPSASTRATRSADPRDDLQGGLW